MNYRENLSGKKANCAVPLTANKQHELIKEKNTFNSKKRNTSWRKGHKKLEVCTTDKSDPTALRTESLTYKKGSSHKKTKHLNRSNRSRGTTQGKSSRSQKSKMSLKGTTKGSIPPFVRRKFDLRLECVACGQIIQDLFSAIVSSEDNQQVYHFDCALKYLKTTRLLKEGEDILYIGGGDFAVVKYKRKIKGKLCFEICERIEFEPKKEEKLAVEWRKVLRQR